MLLTVLKQKIYINNPVIRETETKKRKYFQFFTSLGKEKGTITCKCWDLRHDLTKLKFLDRCVVDLTGGKNKEGHYMHELKIVSYAEPQLSDGKVITNLPVRDKQLEPDNELDMNILGEL